MSTIINLPTLDDSYADSFQPATNYGSLPVLVVGKLTNDILSRSLLKFDLTTIPLGSSIISAVLTLYLNLDYSGTGTAVSITPYAVVNGWNEATVTWNNQPAINNGITGSTVNATVSGLYSWDVLNIVNAWVGGSLTNNGLELKTPEIISLESKRFNSNNAVSQRPVLTIEYGSPEPLPTNVIDSRHAVDTGHEDVITTDSLQSTIAKNTSQKTSVSFSVYNSSANFAEVGIEGSMDGVNYAQEITSTASPFSTVVLLEPLYATVFKRVIYKSGNPGLPATLSIDYLAQS